MPEDNPILLDVHPNGVAVISLNRPARLNAVTGVMLDALDAVAMRLNADPSIRVAILTGVGRGFCAGRDRDELGDVSEDDASRALPSSGGHHSDMIRRLEMPTIAAVNGAAVGAGLGFVLQCDVRIASSAALFRDGHLAAGMSPSIASWYLPRLCGLGAALQVFCQLDKIDAVSAERIGIVSEVVAADELMPRALAIAGSFARWDAEVLRHTKSVAASALEEGYDRTMSRVGLLRGLHARGRQGTGGAA
jgi:enoyl-CoA hydratase/carnithine racemase